MIITIIIITIILYLMMVMRKKREKTNTISLRSNRRQTCYKKTLTHFDIRNMIIPRNLVDMRQLICNSDMIAQIPTIRNKFKRMIKQDTIFTSRFQNCQLNRYTPIFFFHFLICRVSFCLQQEKNIENKQYKTVSVHVTYFGK